MRSIAFLPLVLLASAAWASSGDETALRDLGPGKKLCICGFHLRGAARGEIPPAFLGVWGARKKEPNATPYSEELSADFLRVYEQVLVKAGAFELSPSDGLRAGKGQEARALDAAARDNGLFACVSADSVLGVAMGWQKRVNVITEWLLTGPSGWEIRIKTKAASEQAQGMFPDTTDPALKPVFLQLARESARQFLEQLGAMMKESGSTAAIDFAAVDAAAAAASAPSPTIMAAAAVSSQPDAGVQRFVDNGDGTVTDTLSGLMWAANDNGAEVDWPGAKGYCEGFRAGGHSDWRMPTAAELRGLFDANGSRRATCGLDVDITPRIELTCARVWSADSASSTRADAALFDLEDINSLPRGAVDYMRALPVRSGSPALAAESAAPATTVAATTNPTAAVSAPATQPVVASVTPPPPPVIRPASGPEAAEPAPAAQLAAPVAAAGAGVPPATHPSEGVLHPVKLDGKWGYVDARGNVVIRPEFDSAARFAEGLARVSLAKKITIETQFASNSEADRHTYGWVDEHGQVVIKPAFERAGDFSDGLAPAGRALPDTGANQKVTLQLTIGDSGLNQTVVFESRFDYIDSRGAAVLHTDFEEALPFADGLAAVAPPHADVRGKWGFIDRSGRMVIAPRFGDALGFSEGLAAVSMKERWGFIDHGGVFVVQPKYSGAAAFADGLAAVQLDSKWGYIDRTGTLVIPLQFAGADSFAEGLAPVRQGQTWGYIDRTGSVVIPARFEGARTFAGGVAAVKSAGKWGFIDRAGTFVVAPRFEDAL